MVNGAGLWHGYCGCLNMIRKCYWYVNFGEKPVNLLLRYAILLLGYLCILYEIIVLLFWYYFYVDEVMIKDHVSLYQVWKKNWYFQVHTYFIDTVNMFMWHHVYTNRVSIWPHSHAGRQVKIISSSGRNVVAFWKNYYPFSGHILHLRPL